MIRGFSSSPAARPMGMSAVGALSQVSCIFRIVNDPGVQVYTSERSRSALAWQLFCPINRNHSNYFVGKAKAQIGMDMIAIQTPSQANRLRPSHAQRFSWKSTTASPRPCINYTGFPAHDPQQKSPELPSQRNSLPLLEHSIFGKRSSNFFVNQNVLPNSACLSCPCSGLGSPH